MILYHIYDEFTLDVIGAGFFNEKPNFSTTSKNEGFLKPKYNIGTDTIYEGATLEDIPAVIVPQTIPQMNMRLQLISSGIPIASIYAMINAIEDVAQKEMVYSKWEYAVYFHRNDVTLNQMATALGLTQLQVDDLFINGNKI